LFCAALPMPASEFQPGERLRANAGKPVQTCIKLRNLTYACAAAAETAPATRLSRSRKLTAQS
jgi:hypothetical protein